MAETVPTSTGSGGIGGFFSNVLGGLAEPTTDALGFLLKDKAGLIDAQNESTQAGLLARLGLSPGGSSPQSPRDLAADSGNNLLLWGGVAIVGLIATAAFFEDD